LNLAISITIVFSLLFLALAINLGWVIFTLALVFVLLASFYSFFNYRSGILANLIVAFIVSGTQWGVAIIKPDPVLMPMAAFLFFFTIPRELILDWLDKEGDAIHGKDSLAIGTTQKKFKGIIVLFLTASSITMGVLLYIFTPNLITSILLVAGALMTWGSFIRFFFEVNRKNALFAVRCSHLTFALIIIALFLR